MKRKYMRLQNPFLLKGKRNYKRMAMQSTYNYNALHDNADNQKVHELIAHTDQVYQIYHAQYDIWNSAQGDSTGGTKNFIDLFVEAPEKIKHWQHKIIDVFSENSPEFVTIFSKGRNDIYKGTQEQQLSKLQALAIHVKKYPGLVAIHEEINAYNEELSVAYKNKGISQDGKNKSSDALDIAYDAMGELLFSNMLALTIIFIKNTDVVEHYFDFSLLRNPKKQSEEDNAYILAIPANSKKTADISFSTDDTLLLVNNGTKSISFYAAATADAATPTTLSEIAAGEELEVTAASLGAPANKFLIFVNTDLTEVGEVEILLI